MHLAIFQTLEAVWSYSSYLRRLLISSVLSRLAASASPCSMLVSVAPCRGRVRATKHGGDATARDGDRPGGARNAGGGPYWHIISCPADPVLHAGRVSHFKSIFLSLKDHYFSFILREFKLVSICRRIRSACHALPTGRVYFFIS